MGASLGVLEEVLGRCGVGFTWRGYTLRCARSRESRRNRTSIGFAPVRLARLDSCHASESSKNSLRRTDDNILSHTQCEPHPSALRSDAMFAVARAIPPVRTVSSRQTRPDAARSRRVRSNAHGNATCALSRAGDDEGRIVGAGARSASALLSAAFAANSVLQPGIASAFGSEIALSDVKYEPTECPANQYMPNKKNTVCLKFTATADNSQRRNVEAANIFGFIDDQQNNSAATVNPTGGSRTVLSGLDAPIPAGRSQVSFIVTVFKDSLDLGPLKLRGFKAEPSLSDVEKRFKPFDECEMDPETPGCAGSF